MQKPISVSCARTKCKKLWTRPSQKRHRVGDDLPTVRRIGRQLESCPVTKDGLVLSWPRFLKMWTWKLATVDTCYAFSAKNTTIKSLNTSNWTEVSLVPCRLQKITRVASHIGCEDMIWKMSNKNAQELLGPSKCNVRCSVSETNRWSKPEVQDDKIWFCSAHLGKTTLDNMRWKRCQKTGIEPHLINHCLRATYITVLSYHNCETKHIKSITGHKPDQAVESYNERPSMEQQQKKSLVLSDFIGNASYGSASSV